MKKIIKPILIISIPFVIGLITSCSQKDADKIAEAQACLDKAEASGAYDCVDIIAGIETKAAYLIRCSADFIYQDFTNPNRLIEISEQMQSTGGSGATMAIGLLAFNNTFGATSKLTLATQANTNCTKSESKGMALLASMAYIATTIDASGAADIAADCDSTAPGYNPATCESSVNSAICDMDETTLGMTAIATYNSSCVGGSQSGSAMCAIYEAAGAGAPGASAAAVGAVLADDLNSSGSCP